MPEQSPSSLVSDACLLGLVTGRVRDLPGYTKPKTPLASHNDWERGFVESAGTPDVVRLATDLFEALRGSFGYRRKELIFSKVGATASIECPDFAVHVSLCQDPEDAERFQRTLDVRSFRNPAILDDPRFLAIFANHCNQIVFELHTPLDLQQAIDDIEDVDALRGSLDYDPDCTWFALRMGPIQVHADAERLVFSLADSGDLRELLRHTKSAMEQLGRDKIRLGQTIRPSDR